MEDVMFIPSQKYKELLFLDTLSKSKDLTQRDLAQKVFVSHTMVNKYMDIFEENGLIKRTYLSSKTVKYSITDKGEIRRKELYMHYLKSSMDIYNNASKDCIGFLNRLVVNGYKRILLYGAGEVGEILVYAKNNSDIDNLNILCIIDDDINKIGCKLLGVDIISINDINKYDYDGILISSYNNRDVIRDKLLDSNIQRNKILDIFNSEI